MTWLYISSAVITAGLLVYLTVALLKPEWFE
ncbi:MAG: K(+)-transporting ATPase subunit F [Deltaproteobacteria bacterium]|nr:MAG: K(+)-transporting ATPase subunit F [Deltaproteobacteria bacterium]